MLTFIQNHHFEFWSGSLFLNLVANSSLLANTPQAIKSEEGVIQPLLKTPDSPIHMKRKKTPRTLNTRGLLIIC